MHTFLAMGNSCSCHEFCGYCWLQCEVGSEYMSRVIA